MSDHARFEQLVLPHLGAAYNLARWLARDASDAEDIVQDACIRALKYIASLNRSDAKAWFLTIVRHEAVLNGGRCGLVQYIAGMPRRGGVRQSPVVAYAGEVAGIEGAHHDDCSAEDLDRRRSGGAKRGAVVQMQSPVVATRASDRAGLHWKPLFSKIMATPCPG